jgi:putative Holliday junction resolvase
MRYLGLDYGTKNVGVAVSDESGTIAFPRATLKNDALLTEQIVRTIEENAIGCIVVGDTRSFSGLENPVTKEAEAFMRMLREETALPVEPAWEAGSSIEASRLSPDTHDDAAAATIILQRYLDMHGGGSTIGE